MSAAPPRGGTGAFAAPVGAVRPQYSEKHYSAVQPAMQLAAQLAVQIAVQYSVQPSVQDSKQHASVQPSAQPSALPSVQLSVQAQPATQPMLAAQNSKAALCEAGVKVFSFAPAPPGMACSSAVNHTAPLGAGATGSGPQRALRRARNGSEASPAGSRADSSRHAMPATFGGVASGYLRRITGCVGAFASYVRNARTHSSACSAEPNPDICPVSPLRKRSASALFPPAACRRGSEAAPSERPRASPHSESRSCGAVAERGDSVPQLRGCRTSAGVFPRRWFHNASATARVGGDRGRGQGDALP